VIFAREEPIATATINKVVVLPAVNTHFLVQHQIAHI
jgi:hypothetical protein